MHSLLARPKLTVLQPKGHINASNAQELQAGLLRAVASEDSAVLLVDMEQVESLDSAGLIALVSALSLAQRLNRRLSLCCVSPSIRIIFELTGLDRVFEIFDSRAAVAQELDTALG
ncbi:STAS domain-containing protein [Kamptonema formosum]|uniref:STAS domain-containing protein n=1 Tax=Kamptonema formosum TaxID=331992 RepID=UPI00034A190E|nr:STAS domain-containing protein [Oscillatoria sp. PCC 10802]